LVRAQDVRIGRKRTTRFLVRSSPVHDDALGWVDHVRLGKEILGRDVLVLPRPIAYIVVSDPIDAFEVSQSCLIQAFTFILTSRKLGGTIVETFNSLICLSCN
jgi:hypothetical protein